MELDNEETTSEIRDALIKLPEIIMVVGQELLLKRNKRDELDLVIKTTQNNGIIKIEKEYDETKDKSLSNAVKRQSEVDKRLLKNDIYSKKY